ISYSRSYQFYYDVGKRYGETYTHRLIVPTVDALTEAGWLENDRKSPGHYGEQSRMRATDRLLDALENVEVIYAPTESLLVNDDLGLLDYRETAETRRMRRDIAAFNEGVAGYTFQLRDRPFSEGTWLRNGKANLGGVRLTQYRQFQRGSLEYGGRFYGGGLGKFPQQNQGEGGGGNPGRQEAWNNRGPPGARAY